MNQDQERPEGNKGLSSEEAHEQIQQQATQVDSRQGLIMIVRISVESPEDFFARSDFVNLYSKHR
jgi:hypothetical protein